MRSVAMGVILVGYGATLAAIEEVRRRPEPPAIHWAAERHVDVLGHRLSVHVRIEPVERLDHLTTMDLDPFAPAAPDTLSAAFGETVTTWVRWRGPAGATTGVRRVR